MIMFSVRQYWEDLTCIKDVGVAFNGINNFSVFLDIDILIYLARLKVLLLYIQKYHLKQNLFDANYKLAQQVVCNAH